MATGRGVRLQPTWAPSPPALPCPGRGMQQSVPGLGVRVWIAVRDTEEGEFPCEPARPQEQAVPLLRVCGVTSPCVHMMGAAVHRSEVRAGEGGASAVGCTLQKAGGRQHLWSYSLRLVQLH